MTCGQHDLLHHLFNIQVHLPPAPPTYLPLPPTRLSAPPTQPPTHLPSHLPTLLPLPPTHPLTSPLTYPPFCPSLQPTHSPAPPTYPPLCPSHPPTLPPSHFLLIKMTLKRRHTTEKRIPAVAKAAIMANKMMFTVVSCGLGMPPENGRQINITLNP